jgi:hypothetical protein
MFSIKSAKDSLKRMADGDLDSSELKVGRRKFSSAETVQSKNSSEIAVQFSGNKS